MQSCEMHGLEGCACLDGRKFSDDAISDEQNRSLGRIVIAIIATLLTLAIVAIAR